MPSFTTEIAEVLSPTNPLGIKAGGEGGTTAAPAVVISAILDALREFGVREVPMPATPYAIWSAIQEAKSAQSGRAAVHERADTGARENLETVRRHRGRRGHRP